MLKMMQAENYAKNSLKRPFCVHIHPIEYENLISTCFLHTTFDALIQSLSFAMVCLFVLRSLRRVGWVA